MSWAEVKKINDNMSITLDQMLLKLIGGFHRDYIYQTTTYEIPWDGIFTIRAYCGANGQYGKVVKKFTKGERLTIQIVDNTSVVITSNLQSTSVFHIQLTGMDANVNSNSADSIRAIAIGGAQLWYNGGNARVRSNNGIAAGGGGSGGENSTSSTSYLGYAGGAAYAWGTNCYALGGGGGGGGNSGYNNGGGVGGSAYINGTALTNYCNFINLASGKGYNGGASRNNSAKTCGGFGGNGGCGGGSGKGVLNYNTTTAMNMGGLGYFSDGGYMNGGSARGGDNGDLGRNGSNTAFNVVNKSGAKGYFVGGSGMDAFDYDVRNIKTGNGGIGGFLGGQGGNSYDDWGSHNSSGGNGGYSPYGIGGNGGYGSGSNSSNYYAGNGGDGKLIGGNGGNVYGNMRAGNGGNGFYPGLGGYSNEIKTGTDGIAMTSSSITTSFPIKGMTPTTSIVIIEAGDSMENF